MNREGVYHVDVVDADGWEHPEVGQRARRINVGRYSFLMIQMQDSTDHWAPFGMYRYEAAGAKQYLYTLNAKRMRLFLAKKYPGENNISAGCKNKCLSKDSTTIVRLDKHIYDILSNIPDTKEFWKKDKMMQKIRK